jgi:hypothetical protein
MSRREGISRHAAKIMIKRTEERFDIKPERLAAAPRAKGANTCKVRQGLASFRFRTIQVCPTWSVTSSLMKIGEISESF